MIQASEYSDTTDYRRKGHIGYLDGWRGIAILLLLVGHFFPVPGINLGTVGVNFFFVLSGLLMAGLLFEKKVPISTFYRRRIARIIPVHVVFIALVTFAYHVLSIDISWREVCSALFFVNNYVAPAAGPGTAVMPFGHIWSLSVEEHSYIALSLIAIASRRYIISSSAGTGLALFACICSAIYYQQLNPPNLAFSQWLHTEVAAYGLVGAAWWVSTGRTIGRHIRSAWAAPTYVFTWYAARDSRWPVAGGKSAV